MIFDFKIVKTGFNSDHLKHDIRMKDITIHFSECSVQEEIADPQYCFKKKEQFNVIS